MAIFVTTNPQAGWDCVSSVYEADSKEQVLEFVAQERGVSVEELEETGECIVHSVYSIDKIN